jgi:hypothetical protein
VSNTAIVFQVKKMAIDAGIFLEHVQVIRSKIDSEMARFSK